MTQETINKLNQINKDFYDKVGPYFDSSRQYSWKGWEELWNFIIENRLPIYSILDIGCGNGRFYKFLQEKINLLCHSGYEKFDGNILNNEFKYLGIDNNDYLLEKAKHSVIPDYDSGSTMESIKVDFQKQDILKLDIPQKEYELITLFGVMHHIPSYEKRLEILKESKEILSQDGIICVSFWQFMKDEKDRTVDWSKLNIDKNDLEENDFLLSWNRGEEAYRFCHNISDEEIQELVKDSGLEIVKEYSDDGKNGKLNKYLIVSR